MAQNFINHIQQVASHHAHLVNNKGIKPLDHSLLFII